MLIFFVFDRAAVFKPKKKTFEMPFFGMIPSYIATQAALEASGSVCTARARTAFLAAVQLHRQTCATLHALLAANFASTRWTSKAPWQFASNMTAAHRLRGSTRVFALALVITAALSINVSTMCLSVCRAQVPLLHLQSKIGLTNLSFWIRGSGIPFRKKNHFVQPHR